MNDLLVLQQQLDRLHELGVDGLQQRVLGLHLHDDEELHHLHVLSLNGEGQRAAAERVHAVDVDVLLTVRFLEDSGGWSWIFYLGHPYERSK